MKTRCVLVDDEPHALDVLESHIRAVGSLEIVARCSHALAAFEVLQQEKVEVLFLDIQMPRLLGTDFVKALRNPPRVIFTTAYREYALDGFELDVVDYLIKPISLERFLKAIAKLNRLLSLEEPAAMPTDNRLPEQEPFLYFRIDRQMVKILLKDIQYVESLKDYVRIVTPGKSYLAKQTISSLEEKLPESRFVRVHRSFILALDRIDAYRGDSVLLAGKELPIGRNYKHELYKTLQALSTPHLIK